MNGRVITWEDVYLPNKKVPFGAAVGFHFLLLVWNPIIMTSGHTFRPPEIMQITYQDKLPAVVEPPKPIPPKVVEKKQPTKRAKKAGLSMAKKETPIHVTKHRTVARPTPAPRPFVSKVTMPKFVPEVSEDIVAASPSPGISAPAPHRMTRAFAPPPKLRTKTRGVRASDINFELSDRGSLGGAAGHVVAIPLGEESGETAVLPAAAVLHNAPKGAQTTAGFKFKPGQGTGSGELSGKNRGGYHGVVQADTYVEGSLAGGSGNGKGNRVVTGQGFEIGGPVGDRKIMHRRLPEYPAWAEEKGISATVKIYFTVKPDGSIRTSMRILQSSGYVELDTLAKEALTAWRFSSTSAHSSAEEAWGIITFRFTLA